MKISNRDMMEKNSCRKYATIILTILVVLVGADRAAGQKLDSLMQLLSTTSGPNKCTIYHSLGYELLDVDNNQALTYASASYRCAIDSRDTLQIVRTAELNAKALRRIGLLDSAKIIALTAIPLAREKRLLPELQNLLHGLALACLYKAEFDHALKYNFESLELRKSQGNLFEIGITQLNIGLIYYKLADYRKALDFYMQAYPSLKLHDESRDQFSLLLVNIALCHAYLAEYAEAIQFVEECLASCGDDCPRLVSENAEFCRGIVALGKNRFSEAKQHFLASYSISEVPGEDRLKLDNIVYLSKLFLMENNIRQAEDYLRKAEVMIARGIPYNMELMKVYSEFVTLFERRGDYRKVAHFQQRHMALKDSIYDDEVTTQLMRIEAEHIEKEKNAKIETQSKMLELNAKVISRQKVATGFATTTALLLVGVVILSVRSIRDKRRKNRDLEGRVKKRTAELEAILRQSQVLLSENGAWMQKMVYSVRHTANTVNGLSSLVDMDPASSEKCIGLIGYEMTQLLTQISSYMLKSEERARNLRGID